MVFASHSFILFLFACVLVYAAAGRLDDRLGKYVIIVFSIAFYSYWKPAYTLILLGSIVANFALARVILAFSGRRWVVWLVVLGVAGNLLALGYYKYLVFLVTTLNLFVDHPLPVPDILLPIGISFFTFQQIGFLVDYYRGRVDAPRFSDYLFIVSFFPHSIAGPIVRIAELQPLLVARQAWKLRADELAVGFTIFAIGLFKKTVLVDPIAQYVDAMYFAAAQGTPMGFVDGWAAATAYGFQIYFDFSGYSDMAIGLAYLFGVKLPVNFFSPYRAASIREFWRRWHITLSRFLRDYLFIPLGGSRHGLPRTVLALLITMALGGLWHGANWTFVVWGLLHGAYLSINHISRQLGLGASMPPAVRSMFRPLSVLLTFAAVSFAWVFFRADSVATAMVLVRGMAGLQGWHTAAESELISMLPVYCLIVWAMPNTLELFRGFLPALHVEDYYAANKPGWLERRLTFDFSRRWAMTAAGVFIIAWLAISNLSPFIYFQF
jgi:D-alanyl-lipoteichoic acid acyltransferase DltB (MBOAT superfamily)